MTEWDLILDAVALSQTGERVGARSALDRCWSGTDDADHAQRCVLAHYLADVQDTLDDEIGWDEVALQHHGHVTDDDLVPVGIASAAGLAPSLHLNLGDGYLRRGDLAAARAQVDAGRAAVGALGDDGYGAFIRQGLERLDERVARAEQEQPVG
jgi:hypothetical protein